MKKTAVEYLQEQYDMRPAYEEFLTEEEFEKAKQIEKQQLVDLLKWMQEQDTMFLGYTREAIVEEYYNQLNEK